MGEIWKDIPGYEGIYQASSLGRFRSLARVVSHGHSGRMTKKTKILTGTRHYEGYINLRIRKDGTHKHWAAHRLIMLTFCGESNLTVDHINGIKHDNRLCNLRYCTRRMNVTYCKEKIKTKSSKYVGVSRKKYLKNNPWSAQIWIDDKLINLGLFPTEYEAHLAYQKKLTSINP